jgi:small subunit ribosomal protein S13
MARVCGVDLPSKKHLDIALTSIYGIGRKTAQIICQKSDLIFMKKVSDLSEEEVARIQKTIQQLKYVLEGDLRREVSMNIKRLVDIRCYRGLRHRKRLPVRGQRTHTNARTARGKSGKSGVNK